MRQCPLLGLHQLPCPPPGAVGCVIRRAVSGRLCRAGASLLGHPAPALPEGKCSEQSEGRLVCGQHNGGSCSGLSCACVSHSHRKHGM